MDPKHVASLVLAGVGAACNALASQVPAYAGLFNLLAAACLAVQPYLAMTSPKKSDTAGGAQ